LGADSLLPNPLSTGELNSINGVTIKVEISLSPVLDQAKATLQSTLLARSMRELLQNEELGHDIQFKFVGSDEILKAHRCILMMRSEVFKAMFQSEMNESKTGEIIIDDADPVVMKELLLFIYTNEFSSVQQLTELAKDLLAVAAKYQVIDAMVVCENRLIQTLSVDNVRSVLLLADACGAPVLKRRCIDYIVSNCVDMIYEMSFSNGQGNITASVSQAVSST
jgi:speckle-type POZ protein